MFQLIGYARISKAEQSPALQLDALKAVSCKRVFTETASGARRDRPALHQALDYMRKATCSWCGAWTAWPAPCASS